MIAHASDMDIGFDSYDDDQLLELESPSLLKHRGEVKPIHSANHNRIHPKDPHLQQPSVPVPEPVPVPVPEPVSSSSRPLFALQKIYDVSVNSLPNDLVMIMMDRYDREFHPLGVQELVQVIIHEANHS
jgi:hypothetical protein